ncbi:hypothetical protein JY456_10165 [Stenotrophomonas maltophilia]|nr:hypothetical protein [Stenotrophomonas maltophilia]
MAALGRTPLLITIMLLATGCSTLQAPREPICAQMLAFANSTPVGASQSIELVTDWNTWSKGCTHEGNPAGKRFCDWLLAHSSTEFASANIRSAMACLDPGARYAGPVRTTPEYLTGRIHVSDIRGLERNVRISIEYADGIEGQLPRLNILAERLIPDE